MDNIGDTSNGVEQGVFGPPNKVYRHQISAVCDKLSRQDIDEIVKNFNLNYLDPPVCIDHFEEGSLRRWGSLGSILSVSADGDKLYADISETPMLTEMRERGIVKGWSIGGDRTEKGCMLRHLSGQSTASPYVKGMERMPIRLLNDLKEPDFTVRLEDIDNSAQTSAKEVKVTKDTTQETQMSTAAHQALVEKAVTEAGKDWAIKLEDAKKQFEVKLDESSGQVKELEVKLEDARKEINEWKAKARTAARKSAIESVFADGRMYPADKEFGEKYMLQLEDDAAFTAWTDSFKDRKPMQFGATPGMSGKTKEIADAASGRINLEEFRSLPDFHVFRGLAMNKDMTDEQLLEKYLEESK